MLRLADWPIRRKLSLLTASGILVALLLACLAFAVRDARRIRAAKQQQITALADILGSNATTAIEFSQPDVAQEVLSSLRLQPSIELAALYDAEGQLFVVYPLEPPADHVVPSSPDAASATLTDGEHLAIVKGIYRDGEQVARCHLVRRQCRLDCARWQDGVAVSARQVEGDGLQPGDGLRSAQQQRARPDRAARPRHAQLGRRDRDAALGAHGCHQQCQQQCRQQ